MLRLIVVGLAVSGIAWFMLSFLGWGILGWIILIAAIGEGYRHLTT